jgi:hypothetical protein
MPQTQTKTTTPPDQYDRAAIFHQTSPFNPSFMREAIRTMFRTLPLDPGEPRGWQDRRMHSALLALSALHPRDEIEVMLGVQAMSAYHAAASCFHLGMNKDRPNGGSIRHITAACSAARTFDALLRALERRQAKPLAVPAGRPDPQTWDNAPDPTTIIANLAERVRADEDPPKRPDRPENTIVWTPQATAAAEIFMERERIEQENEGLDIANTEGILPCGGMIMPDDPTPQQAAYMARRVGLMYKREYADNLRRGSKAIPKIRPLRTGDLIP